MSYYTNVILPLVTAESNDPLILWLKNHILLSSSMDCEHCSNPMSWTKNSKLGDGYKWRCINRKCTKKKGATTTIRKGSIFENSKLSLKMYFHVLYLWSTHDSETHIRDLTKVSIPTLVNLFIIACCMKETFSWILLSIFHFFIVFRAFFLFWVTEHFSYFESNKANKLGGGYLSWSKLGGVNFSWSKLGGLKLTRPIRRVYS